MASDELDATTDVVTLAEHADGFGTNTARRLDDHGIETVADILIAEEETLTAVPYVSETRADYLQETAETVAGVEPRDVDFDTTESVVNEAAIPLSVRRGESVLTKTSAKGTTDVYHSRACPQVQRNDLVERETAWAERRDLDECQFCADPEARANYAEQSGQECETDTRPLESDPVGNALDVGLGEKVELVTEDGTSWAKPWCVVDVDEPKSWTVPLGEDFETRTVTVRTSPQSGRQYDLLVTGDEVWMAGEYKGQPYRRLWRVEQVNPVGRISQSSYYQLVGQQQEQADARPEGDDTWRKYQRGETA
ncbi:hypothetical protein BJ1_gp24 [Halorubrum virus BJ1]|uniref:Uncharacterized protein n=1 Tax=Halorubrum virus BJ1 TaxID=416419 RepID=A0ZYN7_9CAUD|nr:hypothetical protein BJ1_gp24 [Halorubrum virus BJ1]CAL92446.1 hypothetical protein [Halorubrum virus BJ1]